MTRDAQRLADLITVLQGNLLSIGLGNAGIALALAAALRGQVAPGLLGAWLGLQLLHSAFNVLAWWRVRHRPTRARQAEQRARASEWASLASGLLWSLPMPWLWPAGRLDLQLLILTLLMGLSSGAIHSLSAHPAAFRRFMLPIVAAAVLLCLRQGGTLHAAMAGAALIYGFTSLRFARALHEIQLRSLRQRDELADLAADLRRQKELAEQANASQSRFLAAASHDIRQPVHTLGLFLGAFDDSALQGRNAALIGPLRASARGLRDMLDGVLDLSRAEAGVLQAERRPLALQALLDAVERDFAAQAQSRGLLLRTVPTAAWVHTDAAMLGRVLHNLVSNALRYTRRGGVLVGVRRRGADWRLQVWDTGVGIAEADRQRLFKAFTRGAQAPELEPQGLGLGLAIAQRFADALGAPITLQSRPGRGSVFTVTLAAAAPPAGDARAASAPPSGAPSAPSDTPSAISLPAGLRVLLVDDDSTVRQATALLLGDWGCAVRALAHPRELAGGELAAWQAEVVLSDNLFAQQLAAQDVAAWMRAHGMPLSRLLVLTGDLQAANLAALAGQGAQVLAKPVEPLQLRQALAAAALRAGSGPATAAAPPPGPP